MRVSIIVPLFNKRRYIGRCLDSISRQTVSDFEVIVVDDGSTDDGPDIVRSRRDPRFRLVRQENAGPGAARNRGMREACGDVLAFLDADDAWLPGYLESSIGLLERHAGAVSVTSGYMDLPEGRSSESIFRPRGITDGLHRVTAGTSPGLLVHMLAYMSPCTTVVRAAVLSRLGGYHEGSRYAEDAAMWLKVLLNETVCFQLRPLVEIHRDASALSSNLRGPRPVEPFLLDPGTIACATPPGLLPLLRRFYAVRACKTAAVLGYWGRSGEARRLFRHFVSPDDWDLPYFAAGIAGCAPGAGAVGWIWRRLFPPAGYHRLRGTSPGL